jgi:hypothetical protein
MDPESPHQAAASEAAESSARSSDTESAIPETSGGSWDPCNLDERNLVFFGARGMDSGQGDLEMACRSWCSHARPFRWRDRGAQIPHRPRLQPSTILLLKGRASALQVTATPHCPE